MTTELTTVESGASPVSTIDDQHMLVIAENPADMQGAQQALCDWFARKVRMLDLELSEAKEALANAAHHGWKLSSFKRVVAKLETELAYYERAKAAVAEGYCIVPDFPVDVVAVRTSADEPPAGWVKSDWRPACTQPAEPNLPQGEGHYVHPNVPMTNVETHTVKDAAGREHKERWWQALKFREVSLPVKFLKPRVLDATHRAMGLQLFDEIGVLPARRKTDPIVVGRILGPGKALTFLIAWFIDTKDL